MAKNKGKKIEVQTKKRPEDLRQRNMLPILENPFEIFDDINRMYYRDPWMKPWWNHLVMNQSLGTKPENRIKLLPVDFIDTGEEYQIYTEMPGINKKDIEILITPKRISICGATETNVRKGITGYVKRERGYSTLCRYRRFPENVEPNNAEAILSDGILQINVTKKHLLKKTDGIL
jgi:HSP20 family protein